MKCNKMTKLGITLASMAVLGTLQVLPETIVPVLGSQVVRAEENTSVFVVVPAPYNLDTKRIMASSYDVVPVNRLQPGESITVTAPIIEGYSYEKYILKEPISGNIQEGVESTLTFTRPESFKGVVQYNILWGYRPLSDNPEPPDQDPSTNNNANTGGGQTDGSNSGETTPVTPPAGNGASAETPNTPEVPDNGNTGTVESPTTPDKPNTGSNPSEDTGKEMDGAPIDYIIEYDIWDAENSRFGGNLDNIPVKTGTINPGEVIDAGVDIPGYTPRDSTLVSYETLYPFLKGTGEKLENGHWLRYWGIWYVKDEQPSVPTQPEDSKKPDQDPVNNGNANTDGDQTGASDNGGEPTPVTPPSDNNGENQTNPTDTPSTDTTVDNGGTSDTGEGANTTDTTATTPSEPPVDNTGNVYNEDGDDTENSSPSDNAVNNGGTSDTGEETNPEDANNSVNLDTILPPETSDVVTVTADETEVVFPIVILDDNTTKSTSPEADKNHASDKEESQATPAKTESLSRVESRHLPKTNDTGSILAWLGFTLVGTGLGLKRRRRG